MWALYKLLSGLSHVVPIDDLIDHDLSVGCVCQPETRDTVIIHHSMDGREFDEPDYRGPPMPKKKL